MRWTIYALSWTWRWSFGDDWNKWIKLYDSEHNSLYHSHNIIDYRHTITITMTIVVLHHKADVLVLNIGRVWENLSGWGDCFAYTCVHFYEQSVDLAAILGSEHLCRLVIMCLQEKLFVARFNLDWDESPLQSQLRVLKKKSWAHNCECCNNHTL